MKARFLLCLAVIVFLSPSIPTLAEEVSERGVTIRAGRILTGANSHRRFYGYSGVEFVFPQSSGGTLTFLLWNDQNRARLSTLNYLTLVINDQQYILESYSTPLDLKESYVDPGDWGPGGGSQVQIAIPAGLKSLCENLRFRVFANGDSMTCTVEKAEKPSFHTDSKEPRRLERKLRNRH
jgi:hypothetical protein